MFNRLFVIVGSLLIVVLGTAFIAPRFIVWDDYRGRLEAMAAEALGAEVGIAGDISLVLLPQPTLIFTKVRAGPAAAPVASVERVEAKFSLLDFLSDHYRVTQLDLVRPAIDLVLDGAGRLATTVELGRSASQPRVAIDHARIVGGVVRLADARSGLNLAIDAIEGEVRLAALGGPLSFAGTMSYGAGRYGARLALNAFDPESGTTPLFVFLRAVDDGFTLEAEGVLTTGTGPKFSGDLTYRLRPPVAAAGEALDIGRGDLVLEGRVEADSRRILLSNYALRPDENRAVTRLVGAAEIEFGKKPQFRAVVSGGVIALPPRDATKESAKPPFELVRLLAEIPPPPLPPIAGRIGLDLSEIDLRGTALRDIRLDATTDGTFWQIEKFEAALRGGAKVQLTGRLGTRSARPIFAGEIALETSDLSRLAGQWRVATGTEAGIAPLIIAPLINVGGRARAVATLDERRLALSDGELVLAEAAHGFATTIDFADSRTLTLDAHISPMNGAQSAALLALAPDFIGDPRLIATFPQGSVTVSAEQAHHLDLLGRGLFADMRWGAGGVDTLNLAVADLGGAGLEARLSFVGSPPRLVGSGTLSVARGAEVLKKLVQLGGAPVAGLPIDAALPAEISFEIGRPDHTGAQQLTLEGNLATTETKIIAEFGGGAIDLFGAPVVAAIDLESRDPKRLSAQLGFGAVPIIGNGAALTAHVELSGAAADGYHTIARLAGGGDRIEFAGDVVPFAARGASGTGTLELALADPSPLAELLGGGGLYLPALAGSARLSFVGADDWQLAEIAANGATGNLALRRGGGQAVVNGALRWPAADIGHVLPHLVGAAGTMTSGEKPSPDGPIDIGAGPRASDGRIEVQIDRLKAGDATLTDARFALGWDAQRLKLRDFSARVDGAAVQADIELCCAGVGGTKQLSGRLAVIDLPLDLILPAALGDTLEGVGSLAAKFEGMGASLSEIAATLSGTGSYEIKNFEVARLNPDVFAQLAAHGAKLDTAPSSLEATVGAALAAGTFRSTDAKGSFSVAGGTLRSANLALEGGSARLFGHLNLDIGTLNLDARYALSPAEAPIAGAAGLVDPATAQIGVAATGTLTAPRVSIDLAPLVDGMQLRATEIELARLEALRAEDEARRAENAAERARIAEAEARAREAVPPTPSGG